MCENSEGAYSTQKGAAALVNKGLYSDSSFWLMVITQFLGAFNDNLFKQLLLLLAVGSAIGDQQELATVVFALPFILFSGFAGYLSDRYSKCHIIRYSKMAEIVVMFLGMVAFFAFPVFGFTGLFIVLGLMGLQSTFFGPGKYGILPELFREDDLPRANGLILMTTFIAIIMGTVLAGVLKDSFSPKSERVEGKNLAPHVFDSEDEKGEDSSFRKSRGQLNPKDQGVLLSEMTEEQKEEEKARLVEGGSQLWKASLFCIGIAVIGTLTSLGVRKTGRAHEALVLTFSHLGIPKATRSFILQNRMLLVAIGSSCLFWLIGGVIVLVVNKYGEVQLELASTYTSLLTAATAIGIAVGAALASRLTRHSRDLRLVRLSAILLLGLLLLLSLPGGNGGHFWSYSGTWVLLMLAGISAGMLAIPLHSYIQVAADKSQKGQVIAAMNLVNFIAILLSGVTYGRFEQIARMLNWPWHSMFGMTAVLILPLLFFRYKKLEIHDSNSFTRKSKES
ncbi:MAG: MFS transporter [Pirellulaceae bacterium]|nr:MFS transporter [Pirellulaceae bacterium]